MTRPDAPTTHHLDIIPHLMSSVKASVSFGYFFKTLTAWILEVLVLDMEMLELGTQVTL